MRGLSTRKDEKAAVKEKLHVYRRVQSMLVIDRDLARCVICWLRDGKKKRYDDIHHVFGRGNKAGDDREHYQNLMCVCRECHPPPAQDSYSRQAWVVKLLFKANETPINPEFEHQED